MIKFNLLRQATSWITINDDIFGFNLLDGCDKSNWLYGQEQIETFDGMCEKIPERYARERWKGEIINSDSD